MKRIKFNHDEEDILKALGVDTPEGANEISTDIENPDCMKMRFLAGMFNGDITTVLSFWALSLKTLGLPLVPTQTQNIETIFNALPEEYFAEVDKQIQLFNMRNMSDEDIISAVEESMERTEGESDGN